MPLNERKIRQILQKHKAAFDSLAQYDLTREKLWGRRRIDITLDVKTIKKLEALKKKTKKPISRIIEERILRD